MKADACLKEGTRFQAGPASASSLQCDDTPGLPGLREDGGEAAGSGTRGTRLPHWVRALNTVCGTEPCSINLVE